MNAEHESHDDCITEGLPEPDAQLSYFFELAEDWRVIRAARAEARREGRHLPLTPFQLRIGREYARMEAAIHREANRAAKPRKPEMVSAEVVGAGLQTRTAPVEQGFSLAEGVPPRSSAASAPAPFSRKQHKHAEQHRRRLERDRHNRELEQSRNAARKQPLAYQAQAS
jgi:hypothetical protein